VQKGSYLNIKGYDRHNNKKICNDPNKLKFTWPIEYIQTYSFHQFFNFSMSSFCKKRTHIPLTDNKKWMVINVHSYLFGDISITKQKQNFTLHKQVALVSGISESKLGQYCLTGISKTIVRFHQIKKLGSPN